MLLNVIVPELPSNGLFIPIPSSFPIGCWIFAAICKTVININLPINQTPWLLVLLSLLVQAVVHCGPLFTVISCSHSPALQQCRPVLFLLLVQQPGVDFQFRSMVPVLNSTKFLRQFVSDWPRSGAALSRDLEGVLYKF